MFLCVCVAVVVVVVVVVVVKQPKADVLGHGGYCENCDVQFTHMRTVCTRSFVRALWWLWSY